MTLLGVPPVPMKIGDAPKSVVVFASDVVHVVPLRPRANVRPIEATLQGHPDAQTVVCQGVAEETRPEMLHGLRKGSGVRGDDRVPQSWASTLTPQKGSR